MTISNKFRGPAIAAVVGSVLMLGGLPAFANDGVGAPVTVKYNDLDPSSAGGAAVLYQRIRAAAGSVCAPIGYGDLMSKHHVNACVQNLVSLAVTSVGTPALQVVYAANNGPTGPIALTAAR